MMKRGTNKATAAKVLTQASWDEVWTGYTAAKRSGLPEALEAAKAYLRAWYEAAGQAVPDWAE